MNTGNHSFQTVWWVLVACATMFYCGCENKPATDSKKTPTTTLEIETLGRAQKEAELGQGNEGLRKLPLDKQAAATEWGREAMELCLSNYNRFPPEGLEHTRLELVNVRSNEGSSFYFVFRIYGMTDANIVYYLKSENEKPKLEWRAFTTEW